MSFEFSLAAVLRVRVSLEAREERLLAQISAELAQNADAIDRVEGEVAAAVRQREDELQTAAPARELHQAYGRIEEVKLRRMELEDRRKKLIQLRVEQIRIYEIAHRNRKMLTDLYDERRAIHEANLARLEQSAADDNFNARRHRS